MNQQPFIKVGEKNDPSVQIAQGGASQVVTKEYKDTMTALGFSETPEGSFVYNSGGRAIWVNPTSVVVTEDITNQIILCAEEIGKRAKINAIRRELDLSFG